MLADKNADGRVREEIPLGRWGEAGDVSRVVAWVASDQAGYVVGSTLVRGWGMTLYPNFV